MAMSPTEHEMIMSALQDIKSDTAKLSECLYGNGKPGLVTRIDRLEIVQANRSKFNWIVVGALVVLLLGSGYSFITQHKANASINKMEQTEGRGNVCDSTQARR